MRRILTTVVVALATVGAVGITASAAEAKLFKTKAFLEDIGSAGSGTTFVFSGHVESKKSRCLGKRKVSIYLAPVRAATRGVSADDPIVSGKTKRNGTFALDSGFEIIIAAPYEARVKPRKPKPGVRCGAAVSAPRSPLAG
ncbi:MAG: hypothetical protein U0R51_13750 [Solirubrobacterales bacterium]